MNILFVLFLNIVKSRLFLLVIIIFNPGFHPTSASNEALPCIYDLPGLIGIDTYTCYDPELAIESGQIFNWEVTDNTIGDETVYYGVISDAPLKIRVEIIKNLRGVASSDVHIHLEEYFKTKVTVDGIEINTQNITFPWSMDLIQTTLIVNQRSNLTYNKFEYLIQGEPNSSIIDTTPWTTSNTTHLHGIHDSIYTYSRNTIEIRDIDSFLQSTRQYKIKYDIHTGILLEETNLNQHFTSINGSIDAPNTFGSNSSYILKYKPQESTESNFRNIGDNYFTSLYFFTLIILASTVSIIRFRRIKN